MRKLLFHLKYVLFFIYIYVKYYRLVRAHWKKLRRFPNIMVPYNFNDKMMWRKIFDRDPEFVTFCDKITAKTFISKLAPSLPQAELLWQGDSLADAPKDLLTQRGFLKVNNANSRNIQLPSHEHNFPELLSITEKWKTAKHGRKWGEWPYECVTPKLLIEKHTLPDNSNNNEILDVRAFVFSGKVKLISITADEKSKQETKIYFTENGERIDIRSVLPSGKKSPKQFPPNFKPPFELENFKALATKLSLNYDFIRVDFMWNGSEFYFGELTPFPVGGYTKYSDKSMNDIFDNAWDLRRAWFFKAHLTGWRAAYRDDLYKYLTHQAARRSQ